MRDQLENAFTMYRYKYTLNSETVDADAGWTHVEGALAVLLRLCRYAGVAPLRIRCVRAGLRVSVSPPLVAVQGSVMTLLNIALLAGVILDFYQIPEKRIRVGDSLLKAFIWISDYVLVLLIASVAVYTAPAQMECFQLVIRHVQQIKLELNVAAPPAKTEKIKVIAMLSMMICTVFVVVIDFTSYFEISFRRDTICTIMGLYSSYYIADLQGTLVVMKWSLTAHTVYSAAAAINQQLKQLRQANLKPEPNVNLYNMGAPKSACALVDCFTKHTKMSGKMTSMRYTIYPSQVQATICRLALSYERISEMMGHMNKTNGLLVMAILMSTFLRLVLTPYYMITHLFNEEQDWLFEIFLPMAWSLILVAILAMTIEPCHWTHEQRDYTSVLLSQLIVHMAPKNELVSKELDQFAKQIALSNTKFTTLGVYTLARPLMAMMLGSVTTYLLIIIQFETVSKQL